jgi:hypothetical protein
MTGSSGATGGGLTSGTAYYSAPLSVPIVSTLLPSSLGFGVAVPLINGLLPSIYVPMDRTRTFSQLTLSVQIGIALTALPGGTSIISARMFVNKFSSGYTGFSFTTMSASVTIPDDFTPSGAIAVGAISVPQISTPFEQQTLLEGDLLEIRLTQTGSLPDTIATPFLFQVGVNLTYVS